MCAITLRRHPIATTLAAAVLFAVLLWVLWLALPLSGNNDHAVGHLILGIPILLLMVLAVRTWQRRTDGQRLSRALFCLRV